MASDGASAMSDGEGEEDPSPSASSSSDDDDDLDSQQRSAMNDDDDEEEDDDADGAENTREFEPEAASSDSSSASRAEDGEDSDDPFEGRNPAWRRPRARASRPPRHSSSSSTPDRAEASLGARLASALLRGDDGLSLTARSPAALFGSLHESAHLLRGIDSRFAAAADLSVDASPPLALPRSARLHPHDLAPGGRLRAQWQRTTQQLLATSTSTSSTTRNSSSSSDANNDSGPFWRPSRHPEFAVVSADGRGVRYTGAGAGRRGRQDTFHGCVAAQRPLLRAGARAGYFEVAVRCRPEVTCGVQVGVCGAARALGDAGTRPLSSLPDAVAVDRDGAVWARGARQSTASGAGRRVVHDGDRVGCGVDAAAGEVYFTHNGERFASVHLQRTAQTASGAHALPRLRRESGSIARALSLRAAGLLGPGPVRDGADVFLGEAPASLQDLAQDLHACVSLFSAGEFVTLCETPRFDARAVGAAAESQGQEQQAALRAQPALAAALVREHLAFVGAEEALAAFDDECARRNSNGSSSGSGSSSSSSNADTSDAALREGLVLQALADVQATRATVALRSRVRALILAGNAQQALALLCGGGTSASNSHSHSSDDAAAGFPPAVAHSVEQSGAADALRAQHFIELVRSARAQDAVAFAREHMRPADAAQLAPLLAFEDVLQSPYREWLAPARTLETAAAANRAVILALRGDGPSGAQAGAAAGDVGAADAAQSPAGSAAARRDPAPGSGESKRRRRGEAVRDSAALARSPLESVLAHHVASSLQLQL